MSKVPDDRMEEYKTRKLEEKQPELEGGCHAWRIPVIERTYAKIPIPKAQNTFFFLCVSRKNVPDALKYLFRCGSR